MSIKDLTITDQTVQGIYVQSQPDRLTGTAQQNKAVFDAYPALIKQRFNELIALLTDEGAAGEIPVGPIEGVTAENVQQALAAIQQNLTAYINKLKAATGAAEVGVSTISGISVGNVQQALDGLRAIQITLDSNIQKLMSENGAAEVGVSTISGMQAQNVQKALEELRKAIDDSVSGIIPGGSITPDMLAGKIPIEKGGTGATNAKEARDSLFVISAALDIIDDLNYFDLNQMYVFTSNAKNRPPDTTTGVVVNVGIEGYNIAAQIVIGLDGGIAKRDIRYGSNSFLDWEEFHPDMPPKVRNLTLQSGFTTNGDCTFFVTQESAVFLAGGVSGTLPANQDTQIGTLPVDVSPAAQRRRPAVTNAGAAYIDIHTDGTVWAHPFAAASQCWFDTSFVAGGS